MTRETYFDFFPVIVLPILVSKFAGAVTTVLTAETEVLVTFLLVFDTELPTEEIGLKSDAVLHTAGCKFIKRIDVTTTAERTRLILTTMIFTFLICRQTKTSSRGTTTPRRWIEAEVSQKNEELSRAIFAVEIELIYEHCLYFYPILTLKRPRTIG
jgi:hypothetical protein